MRAFVFRGAPASGKGTLTKEFLKLVPGKVAFLELDNFRWGFHLYNRHVEDITTEEHRFAYENLLLILESYCKNGNYNLVIEGLFSWRENGPHGNVGEVTAILKKYNFDYKVFFLKANYNVLWERNLQRKHVVPEKEFRELLDYVGGEESNEITISVDKFSVEQIVKILRKYL